MGILLICVVVIIICTVLKSFTNSFSDAEMMLDIVSVLSAIGIVIAVICFGVSLSWNKSLVDDYEIDRQYIEMAKSQDISSSEKEYLVGKIINDNSIIMAHRRFKDNFFLGIFHSKDVAELELFSFNDIPNGNFNVTVK